MHCTVAVHNWEPSEYEKLGGPQTEWAEELVAIIDARPDFLVLDVGCGPGSLTAKLATMVPFGRVIGIDNSPAMIEYARTRYSRAQYPNLEFQLMDAREITIPQTVDLVFSNATLHWFGEQIQFLEGVYRVLKAGGRLYAAFAAKHNAQEIFFALREVIRLPRWRSYFRNFRKPFHLFTANEYSSLVQASGLRVIRCDQIFGQFFFSNIDELSKWIQILWLPYLARIPIDSRTEFVEEVLEKLCKFLPLNNHGGIPLSTSKIILVAEKPDRTNP